MSTAARQGSFDMSFIISIFINILYFYRIKNSYCMPNGKHFANIISLNSHDYFIGEMPSLHFAGGETEAQELSNLTKITQWT